MMDRQVREWAYATNSCTVQKVSRQGRQLWEESDGEAPYASPKNVHQALVPQCSDVALVEAHCAACQCENVHEDHHKNAAVMATAKPLPL